MMEHLQKSTLGLGEQAGKRKGRMELRDALERDMSKIDTAEGTLKRSAFANKTSATAPP